MGAVAHHHDLRRFKARLRAKASNCPGRACRHTAESNPAMKSNNPLMPGLSRCARAGFSRHWWPRPGASPARASRATTGPAAPPRLAGRFRPRRSESAISSRHRQLRENGMQRSRHLTCRAAAITSCRREMSALADQSRCSHRSRSRVSASPPHRRHQKGSGPSLPSGGKVEQRAVLVKTIPLISSCPVHLFPARQGRTRLHDTLVRH